MPALSDRPKAAEIYDMGERFEPGQRIRIVGEYGPLKPVQATMINATERELRLRL